MHTPSRQRREASTSCRNGTGRPWACQHAAPRSGGFGLATPSGWPGRRVTGHRNVGVERSCLGGCEHGEVVCAAFGFVIDVIQASPVLPPPPVRVAVAGLPAHV